MPCPVRRSAKITKTRAKALGTDAIARQDNASRTATPAPRCRTRNLSVSPPAQTIRIADAAGAQRIDPAPRAVGQPELPMISPAKIEMK